MKIFMPFQHFLTFWCCRKARSQIYQDFSQQSDMNSLSANKQYYNWNEASWLVAELCLWLCSHVGRAMILQLRLDKHSYPTYFTLNKTNGGRGNILFCDYLCQGHLNIDPPPRIQMQLQETADSASSTSSPYKEMRPGWTLNTHTNTQCLPLQI